MTWLDADMNGQRPGFEATVVAARGFTVTSLGGVAEPVQDLLDALLSMRAKALFAQFHVAGSMDFDWYASRRRWAELGFAPAFLSHQVLAAQLPELTQGAAFGEEAGFQSVPSITLDGVLAGELLGGGAYERFRRGAREAKNLGGRFCEAVFQDRFEEVDVMASWSAWSKWFFDVAWDMTFLVMDRREQRVTLLCATDTD